jgi:hypothetical protein
LVVGYDGGQNVRDEERSVWQRKPEREHEEETKQSRWGFRGMALRNWLELLVVPLALVVIGILFSVQQDARQQRIEDQRAAAERELAEQRAQDEVLQAYLDQMSQLMLDRNLLEVEQSSPVHDLVRGHGDPVHTLAQARTSTVILRLDAEHNESVTRFLSDSGLTSGSTASSGLLSEIVLSHATLSGAYLPNANLGGAGLFQTDLREANLSGADLSDAELGGADLSGADLSGANLSFASGISNEELEQQAKSLEGAIMPNAQTYEEWLKDKKAQGKDEKNE